MTHTLVTIAVPAAQMDDANAAMVQITGNPADAQTFVAQEWALLEEADEEKTGFALTSNLFEPDVADILLGWQSPIMVRADMPVLEAVADMGLEPCASPDAPAPQPIDWDAIALAKERKGMVVSRLQGRLTLGPQTVSALDALAADPNTPWAMRETINNAAEWRRTSQAMDELAYALGFSESQMDDLFRVAMQVTI